MARYETWLQTDLTALPQVVSLHGVLFSYDYGNRIGVELTNGHVPYAIDGAIIGYVIIDDGRTVIVDGESNGNKAWIDLSEQCYYAPGLIQIVIKMGDLTIGACQGYVRKSMTDIYIDPDDVVPDIQQLLDTIEEAIAKIPADYSELEDSVDELESAIIYNSECDRLGLIPYSGNGSASVTNWEVSQDGNEVTLTGTSTATAAQASTKIMLSDHIQVWNSSTVPSAALVYPIPTIAGHLYRLSAEIISGERDAGEGIGSIGIRLVDYNDPRLVSASIGINESSNDSVWVSEGNSVQVRLHVARLMTVTNLVVRVELRDITTDKAIQTAKSFDEGLMAYNIPQFPQIPASGWTLGGVNSDGTETTGSYIMRTIDYYPYNPKCTYAYKPKTSDTSVRFAVLYDEDYNYISRDGTNIPNVDNARYIRFTYGYTSGSGVVIDDTLKETLAADFGVIVTPYIDPENVKSAVLYTDQSLTAEQKAQARTNIDAAAKTDTVLLTTLSRGRKANTTVGTGSFAFGTNVEASGSYSHAEGNSTTASGRYSHAEGSNTTASGICAHAEGLSTNVSGNYSHAEGESTKASGLHSHAEGFYTEALGSNQHVSGKYNVPDTTSAEIIGNGIFDTARSNARTLDWSGNEKLAGDLTIKMGTDDEASVSDIKSKLDKVGKRYAGLIMVQTETLTEERQFKTYTSLEEVAADYESTTEAYLAAQAYFSADPKPSKVYMLAYTEAQSPAQVFYDDVMYTHLKNLPEDCILVTLTSIAAAKLATFLDRSMSPKFMYYMPVFGDIDVLVEDEHSLLKFYETHASDLSRLMVIYGASEASTGRLIGAAVVGTIVGVMERSNDPDNFDVFSENVIAGAVQYTLTEEQQSKLLAKNANYVDSNKKLVNVNGLMMDGSYHTDALRLYSKKVETTTVIIDPPASQASTNAPVSIDYDTAKNLKNVLLYTEQTLTDAQKSTARTNIDAAAQTDVAFKTDTVLETTLSRGRKANTTVGTGSFAFGTNVEASGSYSHAEGNSTTASGRYSHAEGSNTTASGICAHAEGLSTNVSGNYSHAEGESTKASGLHSHAEGFYTEALGSNQHVSGKYNVPDTTSAEIIGNGIFDTARSNARTLDWSGNEKLAGSLTLGMGTEDETTITAVQLKALLALLQ